MRIFVDRLARGDEDSVVNFWLYVTTFTPLPRATARDIARIGDRNAAGELLLARLDHLVDGVASPGANERLRFARQVIERKGIDPTTPEGKQRARLYLVEARARMVADNACDRRDALASTEHKHFSTQYRGRGLSSDTSISADFAVDRAIDDAASKGKVTAGSIRRVALFDSLVRRALAKRDDRRACRHGQDGLVFPDVAARHARLGLGVDAHSHRRRHQRRRKLVSMAARNGYFFTLDRVTGEHIVTSRYGKATTWALKVDEKGSVRRDPGKDPRIPGALVSPTAGGAINREPPAFSPVTGLFYVPERNSYSIFYLTDPDPRGSMGLGGKEEVNVGNVGNFLTAIDYRTGKVRWRHPYPAGGGGGSGGGGGVLATAVGLVFAGDAGGNLVAHDAATG